MSIETDEDEHSIEMHLPYVRKVFEGYVHAPRLLPSSDLWAERTSLSYQYS